MIFLYAGCMMKFTRADNLKRHMKSHAQDQYFPCQFCKTLFYRKDNLRKHIEKIHPSSLTISTTDKNPVKKLVILLFNGFKRPNLNTILLALDQLQFTIVHLILIVEK